MGARVHLHRHEAVLERVAAEDVGEGAADHGLEPVVAQGPDRVLARAAAAEVLAGQEHPRALGLGTVQRRSRPGGGRRRRSASRRRGALPEPLARGGGEEAGGDDLVGVDVVARQHDRARADLPHRGPHRRSSRASAMWPVTAAAAAVMRAAQEGAPARALPAFEVAVARAHRVLAGLEAVAVHGQAHRAARVAPLGAGLAEDPVEPFGFGLLLDLLRSPGPTRAFTPAATLRPANTWAAWRRSERRELVQLPMKTTSIFWPEQGLAGAQAHVAEGLVVARVAHRARDDTADGDPHARARAVGDHGLEGRGVDALHAIEPRAVVGRQACASERRPASQAAPAGGAKGRPARYSKVTSSGATMPGARPGFDRHVADGHALVHRQRANGRCRGTRWRGRWPRRCRPGRSRPGSGPWR